MIDHLLDSSNLRDIVYALALGVGLAGLTWLFRFCGS